MAYNNVYQKYFRDLIQSLPMDDSLFIAMLSGYGLLPGDTESKINAKETQVEKASYFINHVIRPSLNIGNRVYPDKLLVAMTESGYEHVKELAHQIKSETSVPAHSNSGKASMSQRSVVLCLGIDYNICTLCMYMNACYMHATG